MILKIFFTFISLFISILFLFAQNKSDFSLKKVEYQIPNFREQKVNDLFLKTPMHNIPPPIFTSKALLEIRLYNTGALLNPRNYAINIISFYEAYCIRTTYKYCEDQNKAQILSVSKKDFVYKNGLLFQKISVKLDRIKASEIFVELNKYNIFQINDQTHYIDSLRNSGTKIINPCNSKTDCWTNFSLIEMKYFDKYSSLNLEDSRYYDYNPHLNEIKNNLSILLLLK